MKKISNTMKYGLLGLVISIAIFISLGVLTAVIPNQFFVRMTAINYLDYVFLALTSILMGTYVSLSIYSKKNGNTLCKPAAYSGGIFGFLGFGCALCNKLLLLLLGAAGVLTYVEPFRPVLGSVGIGLMGFAVYGKGNDIVKNSKKK